MAKSKSPQKREPQKKTIKVKVAAKELMTDRSTNRPLLPHEEVAPDDKG